MVHSLQTSPRPAGLRASLLRSLRSTQNLSITGDDITFGVAELLATLPLRSLSVRFEEGGWRGNHTAKQC